MRVLIAEDNHKLRQSLMEALLANGYDVIPAADGIEAIDRVGREHPDVLVLDMVLPGLDGLGVLSTLPSLRLLKHPSIIALSPFGQKSLAERRAMELGVNCLLPKPVDPQRLLKALKNSAPPSLPEYKQLAAQMLTDIGVPRHTKGGICLAQAVALAASDFERVHHISRDIYQVIAAQRRSSAKNTERVMRHAIETVCTKGRLDTLSALFGPTMLGDGGKPTNGEFIALLAERLRSTRIRRI